MGGTRRQESGSPSNCLVVHPSCHAQIESDRQRSLTNGWLVSQWKDPATVPVKLWMGWTVLSDDGSMLHERPDVDAAVDPFGDERVGNANTGSPGPDEALNGTLA